MTVKTRGSVLLKKWRERAGLTQAKVSYISGIDHAAICAYETGYKRPGPTRAAVLAKTSGGKVPAKSWTQPIREAA